MLPLFFLISPISELLLLLPVCRAPAKAALPCTVCLISPPSAVRSQGSCHSLSASSCTEGFSSFPALPHAALCQPGGQASQQQLLRSRETWTAAAKGRGGVLPSAVSSRHRGCCQPGSSCPAPRLGSCLLPVPRGVQSLSPVSLSTL